jgi:cytochrome c
MSREEEHYDSPYFIRRCRMKKLFVLIFAVIFFAGSLGLVYAAGTKTEAESMVKKAIAFYKANGKDKAFAEVSNTGGQFVKEDLYVFVYDITGKCVAHGFNKSMIGMDLSALKDPNGKLFVKERIEIATTKGSGWQDYLFTNPVDKKIEPKTAYVEKVDNFIFGCGAYKQ